MENLLTFACPKCGNADGLVRVSVEENTWEAPIEEMHGLRSSPWVKVDGDAEKCVSESRRTLRIDCRRCGHSGQAAQFVTGDAA